MTIPDRCDMLLQKQCAGQLDLHENDELCELLESNPEVVDRYLDLSRLDKN